MRVFISGMSSTGKTTLINYIKNNEELFNSLIGNKFDKIIYIEELARNYFRDYNYGYSTYEELLENYDDSMNYFEELIDRFISVVSGCNASNYLYIIDRSPTDYVINLMLTYYQGTSEQVSKYSDKFRELCDKLLFRCFTELEFRTDSRLSSEVEDDGFRPTKFMYRRNMERMLFNLALMKSDDSVIILENGSTLDRFSQVVLSIREYMKYVRN